MVQRISVNKKSQHKKTIPLDVEYLNALQSTLSEWESAEDDENFADLQ